MVTNYAYVAAATDNSLTLLDVSVPATPAFKSHISGSGAPNFLGGAMDIYKESNFCYVGCADYVGYVGGDSCLTIIDVTDPAAPTFKGTVHFGSGNNLRLVFVSGNYAYCVDCVDSSKGLHIIDVSNPALPSITGSISLAALGLGTGAIKGRPYKPVGNYVYINSFDHSGLVDNDNALLVVDVSNPAAPTLAASIRGVANKVGGAFCFVSGSYIYIGCLMFNTLTIIDISNPLAPTLKGSLRDDINLNYVTMLYKEGNYCYCGGRSGFTIIDISNPTAPVLKSTLAGFHDTIAVYKDSNYCYVSDANRVYIIDVSNPALPSITGSIAGSGAPNYLGTPIFIATGGYPPVPPATPLTAGSFLARREAWIGGL